MEEKETWIFTFGVNHSPYENRYVEIYDTFTDARKKMFEVFGSRWSMVYSARDGQKVVDRWLLEKLDLDDLNKRI